MGRDQSNSIAAGCLAAFGIYVFYSGSKLPYVSEVGPGPGFFPIWIGVGLMLFGLYQMLLSGLSARRRADRGVVIWSGSARALSGWVGLALAIALFRWLGFALSLVLLTIFLLVALDRRPMLLALVIGAALAAAFHSVFVIALGVSLPAGPWGF
jgi:putative tricarboxylic transport membrane protein